MSRLSFRQHFMPRTIRRSPRPLRHQQRVPLELEHLEDRITPSSFVGPQKLPPLVPGTYAPDHILVGDLNGKVQKVPLAQGVTVAQALSVYIGQPGVKYAEPDWIVHASLLPNDPNFGQEYGLNNTGQSINGGAPGKPDADIDAPEAWDINTGSTKVVVADIDTGIDYNHPDLYLNIWINQQEIPTAIRSTLTDTDGDGLITFYDLNNAVNQGPGKITDLNGDGRIDGGDLLNNASGWENGVDNDSDGKIDDLIGWDFVNNDNDPMDDHSHGTHTGGTVGAIGNNSTGVTGVNWQVQIAAMKFLSAAGSGSISDAQAALDLSVAKGIKISNNSWGGGGFSQAFLNSLTAAATAGHIFVAAAGNASSNNDVAPSYPASYDSPNVIAVAATDNNDLLASFSNFGVNTVDIAAPGVTVLSTLPNSSYGYFSGTSMATPHVTGVVALVEANNPSLSYSQVISLILNNADVIPGLTSKVAGGRRLNAFGAITGQPPPPPAGPSVLSSSPNGTVAPPIGFIDFNFNAPMNTGSFDLSDVASFSGPGGSLLGALSGFSWQDTDTLRVTFAAQSAEGAYTMAIGPQILRASDNAPMDQNHNGTPGEPAADQYAATFTLANIVKFPSTDVPAPISSFFETISFLTVNSHISIADVNAQLNITYRFDDDLDIYLMSPSGTLVSLSQFNGAGGRNFQDTIFDDQAPIAIGQGTPPYVGSFRPDGLLADFNSEDAFGEWQLIIDDWGFYGFNDGTLNSWSVTIRAKGPPPPPTNNPPNAVNDSATTLEDTAVSIPVLANDSDPDNDPLTVTGVTQGQKGSVVISPNNTVTYSPNANANGADSFQYTISDGRGGTATATVNVTITPANDAPLAVNDSVTTLEDTAATVAVLANDSDPDGDPLTVTGVTQGTKGSVVINANNTVTYSPNSNVNGADSFQYTISDGHGGTATATVNVTITPVNDAPVAVNDSTSTLEDTAVTVTVLANDSDPDGDALSVIGVTQGAKGSVIINANNTVTYLPNTNLNGADSFQYTISDGHGGTATATVSISITPVNDPPLAVNDPVTTLEDTAVTVAVLANDSDPDGNALSVIGVTQGTKGSVVINADNTVTYSPNANVNGADSFQYTISDGRGGTASAAVTVTITPVNDPPVAVNDPATTLENVSVTIAVLANDSDPDGDALSVTGVTQGTKGSVVIDADNTVTYSPNTNVSGADSFQYTISDGHGGTATAAVNVTITPVNNPPLATNDPVTTLEDTAVTVAVLANDSDPDGDTLTVTQVTQGANGSVVINADNTVTYSPNANVNGADSFQYTISDGHGGTATATVNVTITPVNDSPVAVNDPTTTLEDTAVTVAVLANDSDPDGDSLLVTQVTQGTKGSVVINADNTVSYSPNSNANGADSFQYTISDGHGGTATATVNVTITPVNDPPVAVNDPVTTLEDTAMKVAVLANDSDPDGDSLSVTQVTQGTKGSVVINADNTVTYSPNTNANGADSFQYTISDGHGGTATATVSVTITPVNDAPLAVNDSATTLQGTAVTVAVLGNDSDPDGDILSVTGVTQGTKGTVVVNADNTVTYSPNAGATGADSFQYTISDGQGGTATATVNITITPVAPNLSINDVSVTEGNSGTKTVTFTVTLSSSSTNTVTVDYATADGTATAGSDYVAKSGTLSFSPGALTRTFTVTINGDILDEFNETFLVNLSNPTGGAVLGDAQGQATIVDNDTAGITVNNISVTEGDSGTVAAVFTLSLSRTSDHAISVNFATGTTGTAASGVDYQATSGTATFAAFATTTTVTVLVNGDLIDEANETFFVNLTNATSGATISDSQGRATIVDDDTSSITINDVALTEGNSGSKAFTFTLSLSTPNSRTVSVHYATADGTATTSNSDYTAASVTLSFTAGQTSRTFTINVIGDTAIEPDETFFVNLTSPTNAVIGDSQGVGTILNDDGAAAAASAAAAFAPASSSAVTTSATSQAPALTPALIDAALVGSSGISQPASTPIVTSSDSGNAATRSVPTVAIDQAFSSPAASELGSPLSVAPLQEAANLWLLEEPLRLNL
ncbi:MAG: tandem-95 repeat protein [Planctomycetes bacterium]|nr:tandem-95 repeat protein [Planctomycetota bacterium]